MLARCDDHRPGFTLLEVLVVAAVIALLVAILIPSLARAREQARMVTCKSNLHQLGTSIITYAHKDGVIPYGPDAGPLPPMLPPNDGTEATSQIWTGPQEPALEFMAMGLLMSRALAFPELMYCPADDSNDPQEELAKVRQRQPAPGFCSYLYRQLDETDRRGKIENLGRNAAGGRAVALAMDMNSLVTVDPAWYRTNHKARRVNVLYMDASVLTFDNSRNAFSLGDQHLADMSTRLDEILRNADGGYRGRAPTP